MQETQVNLNRLCDIVVTAARQELLPRFNRVSHGFKADGSFLTEADLAVQRRIMADLQREWPAIRLLGEEMPTAQQQALLADDQPLWCLDPLDGTSNFANGIPVFSVSLALLAQGKIRLGLVYDPLRDECFTAQAGQGAQLNHAPLIPSGSSLSLQQCTGIIDFKRLEPVLATRLVTELPYASQRSFGSVALDWCWLAAGRGQIYLHGKQNLWDYAAGLLILNETGGKACTLQGEPVFVNQLTPRSAVAALDAGLFDAWCDWLGMRAL